MNINYKNILIVALTSFSLATGNQTVSISYDKETARNLLRQQVDQWTSSKITQIINGPVQTAQDPVTTFLQEADKANISEWEKQNIMQPLLKNSPELFYVTAYYMVQAMGNLNPDCQKFFLDWQEGLHSKQAPTQTTAHLSTAQLEKPFNFFTAKMYQPQLIKAAIKERELFEQGYYIFYHGQQNYFGFYQDFCKELLDQYYQQNIVHKKLPQDFLFIRIPKHLKELMNSGLSYDNHQTAKQTRKKNMSGSTNYDDCLSVNGFLFGSTNCFSCSTWDFVVTNSNCGGYYGPNLGEQIFEALGYQQLFNTFESRIKALCEEYEHFYQAGRLLQIAVPVHLVDECVFISSGGATKVSVSLSSDHFGVNHHITDKVTEQIPYCLTKKQSPYCASFYESHFCVVMTEDMALNPNSGIKVFGYNSTPKPSVTLNNVTTNFADHCGRVKQLIDDIVKAIILINTQCPTEQVQSQVEKDHQ